MENFKDLKKGETMRPLFEELIEGNLPEGFKLEKVEECYFLYHTNPSTEQIIAFNLNDANDQKFEEKCREIFKRLGCCLNEKTKKWGR